MFKVILWLSIIIAMAPSSSVYGMQEEYLELGETEDPNNNNTRVRLISRFSPQNLSQRQETETESSLRERGQMKFKIGLEFQEGSSLCPWALKYHNIQKKPLFLIVDKEDNKYLWHVVIDTSDIEFVTAPFTYKESPYLEKSISSILLSFNTLRDLFKDKEKVTFNAWANTIKSNFNNLPLVLNYCDEDFDFIKDAAIIRPSAEWEPSFGPQVTIQHPLEYTIPLYFGLFGFKNPDFMMPFVASLPFRNVFLKCYEEANSEKFQNLISGYMKKISGLTFLHALTLVQMTPAEDYDDTYFLNETLNNLANFQQVDAKMRLTLMSRRPFSSMFEDLNLNMNYSEFFMQAMNVYNHSFSRLFKVPSLFYKANYAEQFFDKTTGTEKSLLYLLPSFQDEFVHNNEEVLKKLLEKGILSTAMVRNLREAVNINNSMSFLNNPEDYFIKTINSIEFPEERYIMDLETSCIKKVPFPHDSLSPPWFLGLEDSMGAFKDDMTEEEKEYGEAIVESRGIKNVGDWFLRKAALNSSIKGTFLTKPDQSLLEETHKLFKFLKKFGTFSDLEDIKLGMTHAAFKH